MTIRGLKPGTRYVAKIDSGIREVYSQKLVTGPELSPATPDLVYGKVINSQTGGKNVDGAQGVLVYLRLVGKEGSSSALLSICQTSTFLPLMILLFCLRAPHEHTYSVSPLLRICGE